MTTHDPLSNFAIDFHLCPCLEEFLKLQKMFEVKMKELRDGGAFAVLEDTPGSADLALTFDTQARPGFFHFIQRLQLNRRSLFVPENLLALCSALEL